MVYLTLLKGDIVDIEKASIVIVQGTENFKGKKLCGIELFIFLNCATLK